MSFRLRPSIFVLATLLVSLAACASGAREGGGRNYERLTEAEIQSVDVSSLYDVVQRLRPRWLDARAVTSFGAANAVVVFQDNVQLGDISVLNQMSPNAARWLEYMDGPKATATLPGLSSRRVAGAIIIHTTDQ